MRCCSVSARTAGGGGGASDVLSSAPVLVDSSDGCVTRALAAMSADARATTSENSCVRTYVSITRKHTFYDNTRTCPATTSDATQSRATVSATSALLDVCACASSRGAKPSTYANSDGDDGVEGVAAADDVRPSCPALPCERIV
jgi:hypothetical protein